LGDGNSHNCGITTIDNEIKDYVYDYAKSLNLNVRINENNNKTCPTYTIVSSKQIHDNFLLKELQKLNLIKNKHIPKEYLYNDVHTRLELLKGLMDTDGSVTKQGSLEFSTSINQLKEDFKYLLGSLNIRYTLNSRIP
jgi:replicative DNA helicase